MARRAEIVTPDNVQLTYELAGLGSRFVAWFVDTLIQLLLSAALAFVVWLVTFVAGLDDTLGRFLGGTWGIALVIVLAVLIWWAYYPFYETVWNGQTPGKRYSGIRVLREGGFPLDFRAALLRNLLRFADMLPGVYAVGAGFLLFHPQCKRLGDLVAGTVVIRERQEEEPVQPKTRAHLPGATQTRPAELADPPDLDLSMAPLHALTREQLQGAKKYLERRDSLDLATQETLAARIAQPLLTTLGLTAEAIDHRHSDFLAQVVEAYERRQLTKLNL